MKKLNKKILSILMAVVLVATTFSATLVINAAAVKTPGPNLKYTFDSATGTFTISGQGDMYDFRDTDILQNHKTPWSDIKKDIKKVVVEEGVTGIGEYSFYGCENLTDVKLPSTVKTIRGSGVTGGANSSSDALSYGAFRGCSKLVNINFPEGLETIETAAFRECTSLKTITLPDSLTSLGTGAFVHCTSLSTVNFGAGITEISTECFYECTNLLNINWGPNVKTVSGWAFYGTRLNSIDLPDTINEIKARGFANCYFLKELTVRNITCAIRDYAFDNSGIAGDDGTRTLTVKGYTGSTAQEFAEKKGYTFIALDSCAHERTHIDYSPKPTCTTGGVANTICDDCGATVSIKDAEALGHTFDESLTVLQDDIKKDGHIRTYKTCTECHETVLTIEHAMAEKDPESQTDININNHVWVDGYYTYSNTATCTRAGTETYTCTVDGCGTYVGSRFIPTTDTHVVRSGGHTVDNWNTTKKATCTEPGSRTSYCSVCNQTVTEDIAPLGHTIDEEKPIRTVDNTATNGHIYKYYNCSVCGQEELRYEHVEWIEGQFTPTILTAAGCVISGTERNKCDLCGETRLVVIEANGEHQWEVTGVIEPTCTTAGQTNYKCSVCGMTKQGDRTDALGHDYVSVSKIDATCTKEGSETFRCNRCSSQKTDTIDKLGHTPKKDTIDITVAPTCEKAGAQNYVCKTCGVTVENEEISALGHDFVDVETPIDDKPGHVLATPTCQREGCRTTDSAVVKHVEWLEEYTTHTTITEGTCITGEIYTEQCTICNTITANTQGMPLGHEYKFGLIFTESRLGSDDSTLREWLSGIGGQSSLADSGLGGLIGGNGDNNIGDIIGGATDKYKVKPYSVVYRCKHCTNVTSLTGTEVFNMWDRYYLNTVPEGRLTQNNSSYMDVTGDGFINAKDYAQMKNLKKQHEQYMAEHPEEVE